MDLRQLRYFVVLADELHFGRAAERLGMTQPPLSQAIQALERELRVRLFARTKRSVALTPVGEGWLPYARRVLAEADALPSVAQRLAQGAVGSLRLAFVSIADYSVLPQIVSRYKAAYPDVRLTLREATSDLQIEALLEDELDAGLIVRPEGALHASLAYRTLHHEALVLAVPASSNLPDQEPVSLDVVIDEPLILFPRPSAPGFHDAITGFYARYGRTPRIGQEAVQMQTIVSLVSAGLGVALVPESLRNLGRTGVRYLPLGGAPPRIEVGLAWRRTADSPTLLRFIEMAEAI